MVFSVPHNHFLSLVGIAEKQDFAIWLGDEDGSEPTFLDFAEHLQLISIRRASGFGEMDHAIFEIDLVTAGIAIQDFQVPQGFNRQVQIRLPDPDVTPDQWRCVFWGEMVSQSMVINEGGESAIISARIPDYLFGEPLTGYEIHNITADAVQSIERDVEYNPRIDGSIFGNMDRRLSASGKYQLHIDPEAVSNSTAAGVQWANHDENPDLALVGSRIATNQYTTISLAQLWDLGNIVDNLCGLTNGDETYIENPVMRYSSIVYDAPLSADLRFRRGRYLPDYLDQLLPSLGFGWYVKQDMQPEVSGGSDLEPKRKIAIYKHGAGVKRSLWLQRRGELVNFSTSNADNFSANVRIDDLANKIVGYGGFETLELTVEMYRGWDDGDDDLTIDQLAKNDRVYPATQYFSGKENAWRLWVANEGGRYCGTRSGVAPIPNSPNNLGVEFSGGFEHRNRPFQDCITQDEKGRRRRPVVEYSVDNGATWRIAPNDWGAVILTTEAGVYFNGTKIPEALRAAGVAARVRVTGSIEGDTRVSSTASRRGSSPNGRDITAVLDLHDRFHLRALASGATWDKQNGSGVQSRFVSVLPNVFPTSGTDDRDDSSDLADFVANVQEYEDSAIIKLVVSLFGVHWEYEIGDLIEKIDGREISFNRNSTGSSVKKYLQITGIDVSAQDQETVIHSQPLEVPLQFVPDVV